MKKVKQPVLLRTSERGDFKNCQWFWDMHWNKGWSPRRAPTWSWFGSAIHVALAVRYPKGTRRGSLKKVLAAFDEALDNEHRRMMAYNAEVDEDEIVEARDLGHAMLIGYLQEYGNDQHWKVIHTEQTFQIDVMNPKGALLGVYCGTWDLLVWDLVDKVYRLVDHKTAKSFQKFEWLSINDQAGSYLWVAPEVLLALGVWDKHYEIDGIIFNYLRKALPDPRPQNEAGERLNKPTAAEKRLYGADYPGSVSARQPSPLFHRETTYRSPGERVRQYRKVVAEAEQMKAIRAGKLTATKRPSHDCVRCSLFDVCELDDQGADYKDLLKTNFVKRDPYADHREAMTEGGIIISGSTTRDS